MTRSSGFKAQIERAFTVLGFSKLEGTLQFRQDDVVTVVDIQKGFGGQMYINVGFWLAALGGAMPVRVEKTHMYYRLEGLFPKHLETIRSAGMIGDPSQPGFMETLLGELAGDLGRDLRALGTEEGLRAAWRGGRLNDGLVLKEARAYLRDDTP